MISFGFSNTFVLSILAQAPSGSGGSALVGFLPIFLMFGAFYFFLIAPQKKKQKEHEKMVSELKTGAKVVTQGGIFGTVANVKEDRFVLKIADSTKIEVTKPSIASVLNQDTQK